MHAPAASLVSRGFGDAGGFGDVEECSFIGIVERPAFESRRGFGDADGFGDAGGFDYVGLGRRPDRRG